MRYVLSCRAGSCGDGWREHRPVSSEHRSTRSGSGG